jgi:hypothetical protein
LGREGQRFESSITDQFNKKATLMSGFFVFGDIEH